MNSQRSEPCNISLFFFQKYSSNFPHLPDIFGMQWHYHGDLCVCCICSANDIRLPVNLGKRNHCCYLIKYSLPQCDSSPPQTLGDILCSLIPFAQTAAILVNSLTLVGIALDRYWAVVKFIHGTWNPSAILCTAWAVFVWGLAAGMPIISQVLVLKS